MSNKISKLKTKISLLIKLIIVYQRLLSLMTKKITVILHHTATDRDYTSFESIERGHRTRGYPKSSLGFYCAYNSLITGDGKLHLARPYSDTGHAASTFKGFHIDICLTGNTSQQEPTRSQIQALENELNKINRVDLKGHYQFFPTECPGKYLKKWIKSYRKAD